MTGFKIPKPPLDLGIVMLFQLALGNTFLMMDLDRIDLIETRVDKGSGTTRSTYQQVDRRRELITVARPKIDEFWREQKSDSR